MTRSLPAGSHAFVPARPRLTGLEPQVQALVERLTSAVRNIQVRMDGINRPVFAATLGALDAEEALYAALGGVHAGLFEAVRGTVEALLAHQHADGRVPVSLACSQGLLSRLARLVGSPDEVLNQASFSAALAPTALLLWVSAAYVRATGDRQFLQDHHQAFTRACAWLETQPASTIESASLVYRALRAMGELAMPRGAAVEAARYWARAASIQAHANSHMWDAWHGRFEEPDAAVGCGNLLAIAVDLAAPGQARAILAAMEDGFAITADAGFSALAFAAAGSPDHARRALAEVLAGELAWTPASVGRLLASQAVASPAERGRVAG